MGCKTKSLGRRNELKEFHLRVFSRSNCSIQGEIEHAHSEQVRYFRSELELAFLIEEKLEHIGAPRSATEMRFWQRQYSTPKEVKDMAVPPVETGKYSNLGSSDFLVKVLFRQNASWQGEVHWLEADKKQRFRSLLELMELLQEAMDEMGKPQQDYRFNTWEEELFQTRVK